MAQTIKRTVSIEYQAKGLQEIQKQINQMELFAGDSNTIKQLKREAAELAAILAKQDIGKMDPATADEVSKRYTNILKLQEKGRLDVMKLVDEESAMTIGNLNEQIELQEKLFEKRSKFVDKIKSDYASDKNDVITPGTATLQKTSLDEAGKRVLTPEDKMLSAKGFKLTSPDSFIKGMQEVDTILGRVNIKNTEINEKLKRGEQLTAEEVEELNKSITAAKEKGEVIKLSAEQLVTQYQIRNKLENEQQKVLHESRDAILGKAEDEKEASDQKLQALRQNKEEVEKLGIAEEQMSEREQQAFLLSKGISETNIKLTAEHKKEFEKWKEEQKAAARAAQGTTDALKGQNTTMGKAINQVFNYGIAFSMLRRVYRETLRTIKDLDSALTEMAIVTSMNREEAWALVPALQNIAKETGFASTEIAKLSTVYFRQGRNLSDVIELTTVAAKAARIAGISAQESADYLTSAVNGFGLAAKEALSVSDKFAALAASSASSYEELANGLSKFAAQANIAGISMDFALGMLAKGVETTREAPETIGTALKTVIARMRELTDLGKTFEDGMNVNRVETALRQVGVQLIGTNGQFRDMQEVLTDVGNAWETLNTNQRASVAVALAGTRQQSRLIAIMNDFDRTLELVDIAQYSQGATMAQHMEYMKSMEAATVNLQNAWQKFITTITNSETIITVVKAITGVINGLSSILEKTGFIGRNLFTIIVSLVLAIKGYNLVTKMAIKLGLIEQGQKINLITLLTAKNALTFTEIWQQRTKNKLTLKTILLEKLRLKTLWATIKSLAAGIVKWTAYWLAAIGPIGWAIAGLAAVGIAIFAVSKARERSIKKLKEERAELQKNIYETNKFTKDLGKLIDKIDEINNKPIKIEADYEELDSLMNEVERLEEEKGIKLTAREGLEIDYTQTLKNLERYQDQQKLMMLESIDALIDNSLDLYRYGEVSLKEVAKSYSNSIIAQHESVNGRMADQQKKFINGYIDNELEKRDQEVLIASWISSEREEIYNEMYSIALENLEAFQEDYDKILSEDTISNQAEAFKEIIDGIEDESIVASYREAFSELSFIVDNFYTKLGGTFDLVISKIGLTADAINQFSQKALEAGYDYEKVIEAILNRTKELMDSGMTEENATSKAYAEIASVIEDATFATYLYGLASSKTILATTQEVDRLNSVIKNLSETQSKYLTGQMSQADMFQFIEDNADLFSDTTVLDKFLAGQDISKDVIKSLGKEYQNYYDQLNQIEVELKKLEGSTKAADIARIDSLRTQRAQVLVALEYSGILRGLSETQYDYNNVMTMYKRATDLGIESDSLRLKMMEAVKNKTAETILETNNAINQLKEDLNENLEGSWDEYISIVDGVAVINTDIYKKLGREGQGFVDNFVTQFNSQQDALYDSFKELRDATLAEEKKAADKKKKIYEDYFAALDRLESKRERSQSREDLVAQLQRLEGATDERSRQKAKEIRQELNQLDKDAAKEAQVESREAMMNSIDQGIVKIEEKFADVWEDFLKAGTGAGDALVEALKSKDLLDESGALRLGNIMPSGSGAGSGTETGAGEVGVSDKDLKTDEKIVTEPTEADWIDAFKRFMKVAWNEDYQTAPVSYSRWKSFASAKGKRPEEFTDNEFKSLHREVRIAGYNKDTNMPNTRRKKNYTGFEHWWGDQVMKDNRFNIPGYSEGGMVDYTGLAMVHGSSSKPEAFLNASQTEMFAALTSALGKISISGGNSENISIGNITIQTNQLNNKQDFRAAGETLAEAFSSAINRRGLLINAKR